MTSFRSYLTECVEYAEEVRRKKAEKVSKYIGVDIRDIKAFLKEHRDIDLSYKNISENYSHYDDPSEKHEYIWGMLPILDTNILDRKNINSRSGFNSIFIENPEMGRDLSIELRSINLAARWLSITASIQLYGADKHTANIAIMSNNKRREPVRKSDKVVMVGSFPSCKKRHNSGVLIRNGKRLCIGCEQGISSKIRPDKKIAREVIRMAAINVKKKILHDKYLRNDGSLDEIYKHEPINYLKRINIEERSLKIKNSGTSKSVRDSMQSLITKAKNLNLCSDPDKKCIVSGVSPMELRIAMQKKFKAGMSWNNHGKWHVDHIRPLKNFLDKGIHEPDMINSIDNLQPLWAKENLSKSSKY